MSESGNKPKDLLIKNVLSKKCWLENDAPASQSNQYVTKIGAVHKEMAIKWDKEFAAWCKYLVDKPVQVSTKGSSSPAKKSSGTKKRK